MTGQAHDAARELAVGPPDDKTTGEPLAAEMRCSEVEYVEHEPLDYAASIGVGALLWNPKGGEGHVIVKTVGCNEEVGTGEHPTWRADCGCGGFFGPCTSRVFVCECGEDDSARDHHYEVIRAAAA